MAEKKVVKQEQATTTEVAVFNGSNEVAQLFAAAANLDMVQDFVIETGAYLNFNDGETILAVLNGMTTITNTIANSPTHGEEVEAVELVLRDGSLGVNADIVMVSTAKKIIARGDAPCLLYIQYDGMKGKKGNEYKNLIIGRAKIAKPE